MFISLYDDSNSNMLNLYNTCINYVSTHILLSNLFPEIVSINTSLLEKNISVVFISVMKSRKNHIKELNEKLFNETELKKVKFIIYVEHVVDATDLADCIWRFANNIDPRRDSYILKAENENEISHIGFDGTRKTKQFDSFDRDWPNILAMDEKTINAIDFVTNMKSEEHTSELQSH